MRTLAYLGPHLPPACQVCLAICLWLIHLSFFGSETYSLTGSKTAWLLLTDEFRFGKKVFPSYCVPLLVRKLIWAAVEYGSNLVMYPLNLCKPQLTRLLHCKKTGARCVSLWDVFSRSRRLIPSPFQSRCIKTSPGHELWQSNRGDV